MASAAPPGYSSPGALPTKRPASRPSASPMRTKTADLPSSPVYGVTLQAPHQRAHTHDVTALEKWTAAVDLDLQFGGQMGSSLEGTDLSNLLATKAQQYSVFHDELARQTAIHCPSVASLTVKVWAAMCAITDRALRSYEAEHRDAVSYRKKLQDMIAALKPQIEALQMERDDLKQQLSASNDEVTMLRARLKAQGKELSLASDDLATARSRLHALINNAGVTDHEGIHDDHGDTEGHMPPADHTASTMGSKAIALLDRIESERAYQLAMLDEQSTLMRRTNMSMLMSGFQFAHSDKASVGVQTDPWSGGPVGGGPTASMAAPLKQGELLPIPRAKDKKLPDIPFDFRILMSVFVFDRPVRALSLPMVKRLLLQFYLDKGSFDRATLQSQGLRLSFPQYICEYFTHKFGLPQISDMRVTELIVSLRAHHALDLRVRTFDLLTAAVLSRGDGRPCLGQHATDFLVAVFDDLRRNKALTRDRVVSTGSNVTPLELDGIFLIPRSVAAHIIRTRFMFAPHKLAVGLQAELLMMPAPAQTRDSSQVDVDVFIRHVLLAFVNEQVAWEGRIAAAFDRYSRPGVSYTSVLAKDMGVSPGCKITDDGGGGPTSSLFGAAMKGAADAESAMDATSLEDIPYVRGKGGRRGSQVRLPPTGQLAVASSGGASAATGSGSGGGGGGRRGSLADLMTAPASLQNSATISGALDYTVEGRRNKDKDKRKVKAVEAELPVELLAAPGASVGSPTAAAAAAEAGSATPSVSIAGPTPRGDSQSSLRVPQLRLSDNDGSSTPGVRRSGVTARSTGGNSAGGGGGSSNFAAETTPPVLPHPPGMPPGLGVDSALAEVRFDRYFPVFRVEDTQLVDVDSHAAERHVREEGQQNGHGSGHGHHGKHHGHGHSRGSHDSEHEGGDGSGSGASASSSLLSPTAVLESPIPNNALAPEVLLAIADALQDTDPEVVAELEAAKTKVGEETSNAVGSIKRNKAAARRGSVTAAGSIAAEYGQGGGSGSGSSTTPANKGKLLSRGSSRKVVVERPRSLGTDALRDKAKAMCETKAQLAAARRSKRRVGLRDVLDILNASDPWVPQDAIRRMYEHARWRLEEAAWNLQVAGWRQTVHKTTGQAYWVNARTGETALGMPMLQRERVDDLDFVSFQEMCLRHGLMRFSGVDAASLAELRHDAACRIQRLARQFLARLAEERWQSGLGDTPSASGARTPGSRRKKPAVQADDDDEGDDDEDEDEADDDAGEGTGAALLLGKVALRKRKGGKAGTSARSTARKEKPADVTGLDEELDEEGGGGGGAVDSSGRPALRLKRVGGVQMGSDGSMTATTPFPTTARLDPSLTGGASSSGAATPGLPGRRSSIVGMIAARTKALQAARALARGDPSALEDAGADALEGTPEAEAAAAAAALRSLVVSGAAQPPSSYNTAMASTPGYAVMAAAAEKRVVLDPLAVLSGEAGPDSLKPFVSDRHDSGTAPAEGASSSSGSRTGSARRSKTAPGGRRGSVTFAPEEVTSPSITTPAPTPLVPVSAPTRAYVSFAGSDAIPAASSYVAATVQQDAEAQAAAKQQRRRSILAVVKAATILSSGAGGGDGEGDSEGGRDSRPGTATPGSALANTPGLATPAVAEQAMQAAMSLAAQGGRRRSISGVL